MAFDYLLEHARQNVWCAPDQDNQNILAAQKITPRDGEVVSFEIMTRRLPLPHRERKFHVYQIGQVTPGVMGLLPMKPGWVRGAWIPFAEAVKHVPVFVDIYTDQGVKIPLHCSWYQYTWDKALIFAVEINEILPYNIEVEQLYLRVYRNEWYASGAQNPNPVMTEAGGATIKNSGEILPIQNKITQLRALPGKVLCFVNGLHVENISPFTAKIGDVVDYIYDSSIRQIVDLPVKDLLMFTSTLDQALKYLLHHKDMGSNTIDFIDDIDIYVIKKTGETRFQGQYYHRNRRSSHRNVTHRDFSIRTDMYSVVAQSLENNLHLQASDLMGYVVRLYIRNSGLIRPLIYENQRIFELYKLKDEQIIGAMVGVNATNPYWAAEALEASFYCELMRMYPIDGIDIDLVEKAYGYYGLTKVLGDTPTLTTDNLGYKTAQLPIGLYENSTIYEYDQDGLLLGYHQHTLGTAYHCVDNTCAMIEGIVGRGDEHTSVVYGTDNIDLPTRYSYRVYRCFVVAGVPTQNWVDITGTELYDVVDDKLHWNNLESSVLLMVRTDEKFLAWELELQVENGPYFFDLYEIVDGKRQLLSVPMGDLDIWLNGRSLIRDLDYLVDFPRIYIINKAFFKQPADSIKQHVVVRYTGLSYTKRSDPEQIFDRTKGDYGFISHGVLSANNRFDLRDDKVLRITVDGYLKDRKDVLFSEENSGVSIVNSLNGQPYQVKEIIVPLRDYTHEETYALRKEGRHINKVVEDYMTQFRPDVDRGEFQTIHNRHLLYSPFFARLVYDLQNHRFNYSEIEKNLSDLDVMRLCEPYEKFLKCDPVNPDLAFDHRYVLIHPHVASKPVPLNLFAYKFLQAAVRLYGNDLVSLTNNVVIDLGA